MVRECLNHLERAGCPLLGVVLNGVPQQHKGYGYGYYYYDYYDENHEKHHKKRAKSSSHS